MNKKQVKFSYEQELEIIKLYKSGVGSQILGKNFGVSSARILFILNKYNINRIKNKFSPKSSEADKLDMLRMYTDGYTLNEIGIKYNIFINAVKQILVNRGVQMKTAAFYSKIIFNKKFFITKSNELAYFYGFVLGDGSYSISNGIPKIKIALASKDIEILNTICSWCDFPQQHINVSRNVATLIIRDKIMGINKKYWGVIENKTYNPIIPRLKNKSLLKSFLIGLIDADGHVSFIKNRKYVIELVGNKLIMKWVIEMLRYLGYKGQIKNPYIDGKVWSRVRINKKNDVIELAKILGIKKCHFLLKRKWNDIITNAA